MKIEQWLIGRPKESEDNPRVISDEAVSRLAKLIDSYGFTQPLVVDESGTLLLGHTRLRAAKLLGLTLVPVYVRKGLTDDEKRALRISDNAAAAYTSWAKDLLLSDISDLKALGFDMDLTGLNEAELHDLFDPHDDQQHEEQGSPASEPEPTGTSNTLKFSDDAWETVLRAVQKVREQEQQSDIPANRAVELALADYCS